ncbi:MAG: MFS transporter [Phycisphaerae bacterium]|nr:MFS transporter [Phycisphaerae bacterium]
MSESSTPTAPEQNPHPPRKAFGHTYWMLNSIEAFERLAYFGIRSVVPIYIMQATEPGGLHMTAVHKGWIYAWWAIFQSWLPMFTGGIADRYGYKRVLVCAISTNVVGYLIMASFHSYHGFFAGILVLATGTAFFKPALQGSIAQNLNKSNASMGWGVFYWVVNVGAVTAPLLATVILGKPHSAEGWRNLFLASAAYTAMNLLLLLTFRDVPSGADKSTSVIKVFWSTIENIWPYWFRGGTFDLLRGVPGLMLSVAGLGILIFEPLASLGWLQWVLGGCGVAGGVLLMLWLRGGQFVWQVRLPAFLLIMSCFWMMMYQVWDLHPNFIEDWVDSAPVAQHVPFESWREYGDRGLIRVPQQILLTLNAFLIVLLVIPISWLVRRMRALSSMLIGMGITTVGLLIAGLTGSGWILLFGIAFFSLGEMLIGPKKNQYLSLIAPPGKKGLYLGYVNIPVGVGVGLGSLIAGVVYDHFGEKASLALKHLGANTELVARAAQSADWSDSLEKIPELTGIERAQAFELACESLKQDAATAAETLRQAFQYDQGQIVNLGLEYLALHEDSRDQVTVGLAKALLQVENDPVANSVGQQLSEGRVTLAQIGVARFVHLLPDALGCKRLEIFNIVREQINQDLPADQRHDDAQIEDMLWGQFAGDRETLNNLALEYLAQGTGLVSRSVAGMSFTNPVEDIEKRVGIGRTKSFAALSMALGADAEAVDEALAGLQVPSADFQDRTYIYLINQPHWRFLALARKNWAKDLDLLRDIVQSDAAVKELVADEVDQLGWWGRLVGGVKGIFVSGEDGELSMERKLADKPDLVQKALAVKDWSSSADQAARLLGLSAFEARAFVAAEVNHSPLTTTQLLWDRYHPQYKVWVPFAAIGVVAAIALAIFGQMAKRWSDMNA